MKKLNIYYWIFTGLFGLMMLFSGIQHIMATPESVDLICKQLKYPEYIVVFLGVVKVLGVIGILIPGYPRVTEWAYAGLFYDLILATVSIYLMGTPFLMCLPMLVFIVPGMLSYIFYHKRLKAKATA
ncbi:MAG: DoxX family protein [Bacteroidota bacterium]